MIPTFLGITFMVFFILQVAPDGPFERAVAQLKSANATSESGVSMSSDLIVNSSELSPDILVDLRMQYGLDKPIIISEAIRLAKRFGQDSSHKFVNALLDKADN